MKCIIEPKFCDKSGESSEGVVRRHSPIVLQEDTDNRSLLVPLRVWDPYSMHYILPCRFLLCPFEVHSQLFVREEQKSEGFFEVDEDYSNLFADINLKTFFLFSRLALLRIMPKAAHVFLFYGSSVIRVKL